MATVTVLMTCDVRHQPKQRRLPPRAGRRVGAGRRGMACIRPWEQRSAVGWRHPELSLHCADHARAAATAADRVRGGAGVRGWLNPHGTRACFARGATFSRGVGPLLARTAVLVRFLCWHGARRSAVRVWSACMVVRVICRLMGAAVGSHQCLIDGIVQQQCGLDGLGAGCASGALVRPSCPRSTARGRAQLSTAASSAQNAQPHTVHAMPSAATGPWREPQGELGGAPKSRGRGGCRLRVAQPTHSRTHYRRQPTSEDRASCTHSPTTQEHCSWRLTWGSRG